MKRKNIDIDRICEKCEFSTEICDDFYVLCKKRGVVPAGHHCRKFIYDPLKRNPGKIPNVALPDTDLLAEISDLAQNKP